MTTHRFARVAPALFVLLWCSGFVGARFGIPWAPPMHFLVVRFALVLILLALAAPFLRVQWPRGGVLRHVIAAGLLVQTGYFAGVFEAMHHGLSAGMVALIAGLQPVVVGVAASAVLNEKRDLRQWFGLLLGVAGVLLVVERKLGQGVITVAGVAFCLMALLSISLGTVYQKRFCAGVDVTATSFVHYAVSLVILVPVALTEPGAIVWNGAFVFALLWVSLVVSIGAIGILLWLLRHGEAGQVSGLFFLVPPTTALIAWLVFGEDVSALMWLGMAVAAAGVWLGSARVRGRTVLPE
ncbi:DMT family transporter [Silvimonas amylolytica]|uniref:Peptide ABC transporter ATP-binding protein n=1 Tax=Silvimonas amylolytica TaxID=449663 RepID=A0ABQ2PFN1_9NEIS|nr:DMT family transporter [Silvimonas amylolytica]GGP24379.1 peptide ABC transporter ATP-binding protein [Silvimonas amylolytica]